MDSKSAISPYWRTCGGSKRTSAFIMSRLGVGRTRAQRRLRLAPHPVRRGEKAGEIVVKKRVKKGDDRGEKAEKKEGVNIVEVKELQESKSLITEDILKSLPDWFGIEESTRAYIEGVKDKLFLAAFDGEKPVGFVSLKKHFSNSYEVYVMGVYPEYHGQGIGKLLMRHAEEALANKNVEFLQVKTLSEGSPDTAETCPER